MTLGQGLFGLQSLVGRGSVRCVGHLAVFFVFQSAFYSPHLRDPLDLSHFVCCRISISIELEGQTFAWFVQRSKRNCLVQDYDTSVDNVCDDVCVTCLIGNVENIVLVASERIGCDPVLLFRACLAHWREIGVVDEFESKPPCRWFTSDSFRIAQKPKVDAKQLILLPRLL